MADTIDFLHPLSTPQRLADIFELVESDVSAKSLAQMMRGHAAELNIHADLLDPPEPERVQFDQLRVGQYVEHQGDWWQVVAVDACSLNIFDGEAVNRVLLAHPDHPDEWVEDSGGHWTLCGGLF